MFRLKGTSTVQCQMFIVCALQVYCRLKLCVSALPVQWPSQLFLSSRWLWAPYLCRSSVSYLLSAFPSDLVSPSTFAACTQPCRTCPPQWRLAVYTWIEMRCFIISRNCPCRPILARGRFSPSRKTKCASSRFLLYHACFQCRPVCALSSVPLRAG